MRPAGAVCTDQQVAAVGGGESVIASVRTVMSSVVAIDPVHTVRSCTARNSEVLSHQTPRWWNLKVRLNVGETFSFSECAPKARNNGHDKHSKATTRRRSS